MRSGGLHLHFFSISLSPQQMTGGSSALHVSESDSRQRRQLAARVDVKSPVLRVLAAESVETSCQP
jgi:hypothetical protein